MQELSNEGEESVWVKSKYFKFGRYNGGMGNRENDLSRWADLMPDISYRWEILKNGLVHINNVRYIIS